MFLQTTQSLTCTNACACGADEVCTNTAVHQTEELENTDDIQDNNQVFISMYKGQIYHRCPKLNYNNDKSV